MKNILFVVLLILFICSELLAKQHLMFSQRTSTPNYYVDTKGRPGLYVNNILVVEGDQLVLETGEVIFFKKLLGHGQNTIVILDNLNNAVRIAQFIDSRAMELFLGYLETHLILSNYIPKKHLVSINKNHQTQSPYTLSVEWLPIERMLSEYSEENHIMDDRKFNLLIEFLESFKGISSIGDFTANQIGYVNDRGWVLFDFGVGVSLSLNSQPKSTEVINNLWFKNSISAYLYNRIFNVLSARDYILYNQNINSKSCNGFLN